MSHVGHVVWVLWLSWVMDGWKGSTASHHHLRGPRGVITMAVMATASLSNLPRRQALQADGRDRCNPFVSFLDQLDQRLVGDPSEKYCTNINPSTIHKYCRE